VPQSAFGESAGLTGAVDSLSRWAEKVHRTFNPVSTAFLCPSSTRAISEAKNRGPIEAGY